MRKEWWIKTDGCAPDSDLLLLFPDRAAPLLSQGRQDDMNAVAGPEPQHDDWSSAAKR